MGCACQTTNTRWEYQIYVMQYSILTLPQMLNHMGEQGWELVNIKENQYIFKRPMPTATQPQVLSESLLDEGTEAS